MLQIRAETGGKPVEVIERQRAAHAGKGSTAAKTRHRLIEHVTDRAVLIQVDLFGHALRIGLEPDFFHGVSSMNWKKLLPEHSGAALPGDHGDAATRACL